MPSDLRTTRVELRLADGLASIEFELAQPKNSFRAADVAQLTAVLDDALAQGARCILLRGAGGTFSAGWDVASIDPRRDDPVAVIRQVVAPFLVKLRGSPVPTVSAVEGAALGFGFGLALSCDLCVADANARFGSPFRQIGMVPDSGTHHLLRDRIGHARASELIYTGRLVNGEEAARIGLVNRAVAGNVAEAAAELAQAVACGPTQAFRLSKEVLLANASFSDSLEHEARQLAAVFRTADLQEGIRAFQERRKPVFQGR